MFEIKKITNSNRIISNNFLKDYWYSTDIVSRGFLYDGTKLNGFIAYYNNKAIGLITYIIKNNECEVISLNSIIENNGVGSTLLNAVIDVSKVNNCNRIFLITTNDNIHAISFYQKRGFYFSNIYIDSIKKSRTIKNSIPIIGENNIPIRDELELEYLL